jgi:hypothetical protein
VGELTGDAHSVRRRHGELRKYRNKHWVRAIINQYLLMGYNLNCGKCWYKNNGITILTLVSIKILLEISKPAMHNPHQSSRPVGCTEVLAV